MRTHSIVTFALLAAVAAARAHAEDRDFEKTRAGGRQAASVEISNVAGSRQGHRAGTAPRSR